MSPETQQLEMRLMIDFKQIESLRARPRKKQKILTARTIAVWNTVWRTTVYLPIKITPNKITLVKFPKIKMQNIEGVELLKLIS